MCLYIGVYVSLSLIHTKHTHSDTHIYIVVTGYWVFTGFSSHHKEKVIAVPVLVSFLLLTKSTMGNTECLTVSVYSLLISASQGRNVNHHICSQELKADKHMDPSLLAQYSAGFLLSHTIQDPLPSELCCPQ